MDDAGEPIPEDVCDIEELIRYPEMLLNRESNPGLPRLAVSNHMTTGRLLVMSYVVEDFR